ncbi:MAG: choice-of-anchor D domain-containing protein, partial [Actinomycetota bacterium]
MSRFVRLRGPMAVIASLAVVFLAALPAHAVGPAAQITPGSLGFGNQQIQTSSFTQFVDLRNVGDSPMTVGAVVLLGTDPTQFSIQSDACSGAILVPGQNCFVTVSFAPTSTGLKSATLRLPNNDPDGPETASLTGTGVNPAVSINPSSLGFGNQQIQTSSFTQFVEVRNIGTGNGPINVGPVTLGGTAPTQFSIQNDQCSGVELSPGVNCFVQVSFAPTTTGAKNASLLVPTNDPDGPGSAALNGNGVNPAVSINPSSLLFGSVAVGSSSAPQFVDVRNVGTGNGPIDVGLVEVIGADGAMFPIQNDQCTGVQLPPGGNCFVQVAFTPASVGPKAGSLRIPTNDPDGPATVALSGTGISPITISPSSINFGNVEVGNTSPGQFVTLT